MLLNLPVQYKNETPVMSSVDLAKLCVGENKDAHSNFMKKAEKVLGDTVVNFYEREKYNNGRNERVVLMLPEREACLMAMSYSYELQAYVFDEWQKIKSQKQQVTLPQTYLEALEKLIEVEKEKISITAERDNAIATKAHINDKRTATLMNKASQDAKKIKKLESQLQDVGEYKSLIAAGLPQRFECEVNPKAMTWRALVKISDEMGLPPKKVNDPRYGMVNTYHVDVIDEFINRFL